MITFKEYILESLSDKGILKAIFIVGLPGAGKTWVSKQLHGKISPRLVDTDRATEYLLKKTGTQNWAVIGDTAHKVTKSTLFNYLNGMLPVFVAGSSNNASNVLHRVGILESLGYDVGMIFVDTSLDTALHRASQRERHVDPEYIHQAAAEANENMEYFRSKFNFFKVIKNDNDELTQDLLDKAAKVVQQFFSKPVTNPVGKRIIDELKTEKGKYLLDRMSKEELEKKVSAWYR